MKKFLCCLFFLPMLGLCPVLPVQGADVYEMSDVPIAGEGESATMARELALTTGKLTAFIDLMDTIVSKEDRAKVVIPPVEEIEPFVLDVSVSNEKAGTTKYYGALSVRFKAPEVRRYLEAQQVGFLARLPQPALVLPVYQNETGVTVLTENNPMLNALKLHMPANRLFTFKVPQGDDEENALAIQGLNGNLSALKSLAQKYYVSNILVLRVVKSGEHFAVSTQMLPAGSAPEAEIQLDVSDDRESETRICADLLKDTVREMSRKWLYLAQNSAQPLMIYQVYAPIEKMSDLSQIKQRLEKLNFADQVDIKGLSNKQLAVDFHYKGTIAELGAKLRLNGLMLTVGQNSVGETVYLLRMAEDVAVY